MEDETREKLTNGNVWVRGFHSILFLIAYNIAEIILILLAIFQFLSVLITGRANEPLLRFGKNLSIYVEEIFEFLTFNTEVRPFPFEPWPDEPAGGQQWLDPEPEPVDIAEETSRSPVDDDPVEDDDPGKPNA